MAKFGVVLVALAGLCVCGAGLKTVLADAAQRREFERQTQRQIRELSHEVDQAHDALLAAGRTSPLIIERTNVQQSAPSVADRGEQKPLFSEDAGTADEARTAEESRLAEAVADTRQKGAEKEAAFFRQDDGGAVGQSFAVKIQTAAIHLSTTGRQVGAVECRAQSCRFEADFSSTEEHNKFFDEMFTVENPPVQMGAISVPIVEKSPDGKVHAVFHIARPEASNSPSRAN